VVLSNTWQIKNASSTVNVKLGWGHVNKGQISRQSATLEKVSAEAEKTTHEIYKEHRHTRIFCAYV